jgi:hypothetical protein
LNQITCGIDWAEGHHDLALLDHEGRLVAKKRIVESVEGFVELITLLAEAGDSAESPIPVAIETRSMRSIRWQWLATASGTASRVKVRPRRRHGSGQHPAHR